MSDGGNVVAQTARSEHISVDDGENINAKRVGVYGSGTDHNWQRYPLPLIDAPYDSTAFSNADANGNYQTIVFKSGVTTVRTLTLAFDGSSNVTSITRS